MSNHTTSRNCTDAPIDLTLPFVPTVDCLANRKYIGSILPPLFYILSLLGTIGNLCSLRVCLRPSRPWSIGSVGMLNIALCDLAYLVSMVPWAVCMSADYDWTMGYPLCIVVKVLYFVGLTSSTLFISAVSIDRYLAITYPIALRMVRTPRNSALVSLLLWAVTGVLVYLNYPNIVYLHNRDVPICGVVVVSSFNSVDATYNLLSYYSLQVSLPLLLVVPSYIKIMARVKQLRKQWGPGSVQGRDKALWLIYLCVANFLMCWVPGQLLDIISCVVFFTVDDCTNTCKVANIVNVLVEASQLLSSLNACLDPFLFHMNHDLGEVAWKAWAWSMHWGSKWSCWCNKEDLRSPPVET
ncbi:type-1 angiotensin II receptor-like [Denticeps clupeoides]|uniref:type-1 angiotensin II receptor-like n=1 Tax=Denticeps clupeoides TaxID=299321 RepID=UPI0010A51492|nr:type-1 angiotensin II receptor-like [Denticeps clupeoides]